MQHSYRRATWPECTNLASIWSTSRVLAPNWWMTIWNGRLHVLSPRALCHIAAFVQNPTSHLFSSSQYMTFKAEPKYQTECMNGYKELMLLNDLHGSTFLWRIEANFVPSFLWQFAKTAFQNHTNVVEINERDKLKWVAQNLIWIFGIACNFWREPSYGHGEGNTWWYLV